MYVVARGGTFAVTAGRLYRAAAASRPLDARHRFRRGGERFLGTPYLWGGKSAVRHRLLGLVQVSLTSAGTGCPRDSDMQCEGSGGT
jgi:cell wall-associated NlpC family hydrolase